MYIIEIISNVTSSDCGFLCPTYQNEKLLNCHKCDKMIIKFLNNKPQDEQECLNMTTDLITWSSNQRIVYKVPHDFQINFPNDETLDHKKNHLCSIDMKLVEHEDIDYKKIIIFVIPSICFILLLSLLIFTLSYSTSLYSKNPQIFFKVII